MARRKGFTDKQVADLKLRPNRYAHPDPECLGHYVRVTPSGAKSFVAVARDPYGKQIWTTIASTGHVTIAEARDRCREIIKRVKAGKPAVEPAPVTPDSFQAVAELWIKRHVEKAGLITQPEIERILAKYIYPRWQSRPFTEITRTDVAALLDHVEDHHGARQADYVLAIVSKLTRWYATRRSTYVSPVVPGMRRAAPVKRDRILDDDELRLVWNKSGGTLGAVIRLALLTAQRREKIVSMRRDSVVDGVWTVPHDARQKGTGGALVLPQAALDVINAQPRIAGNPYVFAGRDGGYYGNLPTAKAAFDKAAGLANWTLHDLRRSSRSLLSRAGVSSDTAERVLGHMIKGIAGTYDRHSFTLEKADALRRLAALVETIVNPPAENILPMRKALG
jgi:integrase